MIDLPLEILTPLPRDGAEMAPAHIIENKVEAAYRRGDLFVKRRQTVQAWANYLDGLRKGAKVLPLKGKISSDAVN